jgi:hypothetical protein
VFEFLDVDLKRYMEAGNSQGQPLSLELCQVSIITLSLFPDILPGSAGSPVTTRHIFASSDQRSPGSPRLTTFDSEFRIQIFGFGGVDCAPTARVSRDPAPCPAHPHNIVIMYI